MNVEDALVKPDWSVRRVMQQIERNGQATAVAVDDAGRLLATVTDGDSQAQRLYADNRKDRDLLGWYPQQSTEERPVKTLVWGYRNLERGKLGAYTI